MMAGPIVQRYTAAELRFGLAAQRRQTPSALFYPGRRCLICSGPETVHYRATHIFDPGERRRGIDRREAKAWRASPWDGTWSLLTAPPGYARLSAQPEVGAAAGEARP